MQSFDGEAQSLINRQFLSSIPQIDPNVLNDIEIEAQYLASNIDNLTENLCNLVHSVGNTRYTLTECTYIHSYNYFVLYHVDLIYCRRQRGNIQNSCEQTHRQYGREHQDNVHDNGQDRGDIEQSKECGSAVATDVSS